METRKIYIEVPCTEVGSNPEHRLPEREGEYFVLKNMQGLTIKHQGHFINGKFESALITAWLEVIELPTEEEIVSVCESTYHQKGRIKAMLYGIIWYRNWLINKLTLNK